jgi:hypothetical protein
MLPALQKTSLAVWDDRNAQLASVNREDLKDE